MGGDRSSDGHDWFSRSTGIANFGPILFIGLGFIIIHHSNHILKKHFLT